MRDVKNFQIGVAVDCSSALKHMVLANMPKARCVNELVIQHAVKTTLRKQLIRGEAVSRFEPDSFRGNPYVEMCFKKFSKDAEEFFADCKKEQFSEAELAQCFVLRYSYGFDFKEILAFRFMDNPASCIQFISPVDVNIISRGANEPYARPMVAYKNHSHRVFRDYFKRDVRETRNLSQDEFFEFLNRHERFVIKDSYGEKGYGFSVVDSASIADQSSFLNKLQRKPLIIEEFIRQSSQMEALNSSCVNTVRVVCVNGDKCCIPLYFLLRMGVGGSIVDNACQGGIFAAIDSEDGRLGKYAYNEYGNEFERHPDSGVVFSGVKIPEFASLKEISMKATRKIEGVGFVGWDFAHTDKGWIMIEGNTNPAMNIIQIAHGKPCKNEVIDAMEVVRNRHAALIKDALGCPTFPVEWL